MNQPLIIVKNEATICGLSKKLENIVKKYLTISNPLFEKRIELGLASWGCPPQLQYFTKQHNSITVPVGALAPILQILRENGLEITSKDIKDVRLDKKLEDYFSKIKFKATLRPYQKEMLDATKNKTIGVIEAMTGAGKTIFALARILHSQRPTLFLVHTVELANQTIESFVKFTNLKKDDIGLIGNGRFELKPITIGLHQTLSKLPDYKFELVNSHISQVIGDEIHIIAAETWYNSMKRLYAKYKWGISATPKRGDGLTKVIHWATGPKIYTVQEKDLKGVLIKPTVEYIDTSYKFPLISTQEYQEMITDLATDLERNTLILNELKKYSGKYTIMLCERLTQVEYFHKQLKNSVMLTSKMSKKDRENTMSLVKSGKKQIIASTYSLFSTGIDIPALELLLLCSPIKSEIRLRQSAGRLMRKSPGKTSAKILDFVDNNVGLLKNAARKRQWILRNL
jgi:superfamily II DNA or RNA helicase